MLSKLPMEFEFDHVGIAVSSIEEGAKFYLALGFQVQHIEEVESEKVKVAMLEMANQSKIELLEPTDPRSPIAKFIAKRGFGIHHICIRVKNIEQKLEVLKKSGYQLINESPKMGAHNCKIAFVHPKATGGVLLELSEPTSL